MSKRTRNTTPKPIPALKFPMKKDMGPIKPGDLRRLDSPPDPLENVVPEGDFEADNERELSAVLEGFKKRADRDHERFRLAVDTEFWFAVCFQSRAQKEAFLRAFGWIVNGDKYIDGTWLCYQYGIEIDEVHLANKSTRKDDKWKSIADPELGRTPTGKERPPKVFGPWGKGSKDRPPDVKIDNPHLLPADEDDEFGLT